MKLLVADDDFDLRLILQTYLPRWGFDLIHANDGIEAWQVLQGADPPRLAIIDWMMPGMDGLEVCRLVRDHLPSSGIYLILLTARHGSEDMAIGLVNGADEFLTKPIDFEVLRCRLLAARRIVGLQEELARCRAELKEARTRIQELEGLTAASALGKQSRAENLW
jgi:DNA-binding response OmpR family regulator